MKYLIHSLALIGCLLMVSAAAPAQKSQQQMPAQFEANRIFVQPVTPRGDTLTLYTDTGGGSIATPGMLKRFGLSSEQVKMGRKKGELARLPKFLPEADVPELPRASTQDAPMLKRKYKLLDGRLLVRRPGDVLANHIGEGMLGREWFSTRTWTFDYPGEKLTLHKSYSAPEDLTEHRVPLHFKTDDQGRHALHFPRVQAIVDRDTLNFLFDTGATIVLKEAAMERMEVSLPQVFGGSYIIKSIYERWRKDHPGWKVVKNASQFNGADLIRVPEVHIAGHAVGPVWFAVRPDRNFRKGMARWMDQPVDGALGGSLFQYFRITVDYPDEYAVFDHAVKQ